MNQFNPLKYRGVFDYPIIQTHNLLPSRNMTVGEEITQKYREPANPVNTSGHVLEFLGWSGGATGTGRRKPTYLGKPSAGRVLDQREAWIQIWLQKGRNEYEKEQLRIAAQQGRKEAGSVSAKKSTQR